MLLYVHRNRRLIRGTGGKDGHLDFHTAPEFSAKDYKYNVFIIFADAHVAVSMFVTGVSNYVRVFLL